MTDRAKIIIAEARKLSADERLEIADALMASLGEPDAAHDQAWLEEAKHRLTAYRRREMAARDLDTVLAKYIEP